MRVRDVHVHTRMSDRRDDRSWLALLDEVDAAEPSELLIHIILDHLSTHTAQIVPTWLEAHPRWTFHFTAKYASWMNGAENTISHVRRNCLARHSVRSVAELNQHPWRTSNATIGWGRSHSSGVGTQMGIIRAMRRGYMKSGVPVPWETLPKRTQPE